MSESLLRTPLADWHTARGARMVPFAGWWMPLQYTSIVQEHHACRRAAALFDISHMGRLELRGEDACRMLDQLLTRRVTDMRPGVIRYSLVTHDQGGVLDDVLVYRLPEAEGQEVWWLVVNAANRQKIWQWLERHQGDLRVTIEDRTISTAMMALQGPRAVALAGRVLGQSFEGLRAYRGVWHTWRDTRIFVSRTGYTGEDGVELVVPAELGPVLWQPLWDAGQPWLEAAGLAARDSLRLEAAMPLYGHELSEEIDPWEADLGFAVDLQGRSFPGHTQLEARASHRPARRRVGLLVEGRRVPRENYRVLRDGQEVGWITSGGFSPTLDRPIAMGYVQDSAAELGTELQVDIRGRAERAVVTRLPFYRRAS